MTATIIQFVPRPNPNRLTSFEQVESVIKAAMAEEFDKFIYGPNPAGSPSTEFAKAFGDGFGDDVNLLPPA